MLISVMNEKKKILKKWLEIQRLKAKEYKLTVPEYLTLVILHKFAHIYDLTPSKIIFEMEILVKY